MVRAWAANDVLVRPLSLSSVCGLLLVLNPALPKHACLLSVAVRLLQRALEKDPSVTVETGALLPCGALILEDTPFPASAARRTVGYLLELIRLSPLGLYFLAARRSRRRGRDRAHLRAAPVLRLRFDGREYGPGERQRCDHRHPEARMHAPAPCRLASR